VAAPECKLATKLLKVVNPIVMHLSQDAAYKMCLSLLEQLK
jgi:hypothetical protein